MAAYAAKVSAAIIVLIVALGAVFLTQPSERAVAEPARTEVPAATENPVQVPSPVLIPEPVLQIPTPSQETPNVQPAVSKPLVEQPTTVAPQVPLIPSTPAPVVRVEIRDFAYVPMNLTIKKGTQVMWDVTGKYKHGVNVRLRGETTGVQSPLITTGQNWNHTFATEGEYFIVNPVFPFVQGHVLVEE